MQDVETDLIIDFSPVHRKKKKQALPKILNMADSPKKPKTPSKIVLK